MAKTNGAYEKIYQEQNKTKCIHLIFYMKSIYLFNYSRVFGIIVIIIVDSF